MNKDDIDEDAMHSCKILRKCMDIRHKYISAHPIPPQDMTPAVETLSLTTAPIINSGFSSPKRDTNNIFRRRQDPEYDVFKRVVPDRLEGHSYRFGADGLFSVHCTASADPERSLYPVTSFAEFVTDFEYVRKYTVVLSLKLLHAQYSISYLLFFICWHCLLAVFLLLLVFRCAAWYTPAR